MLIKEFGINIEKQRFNGSVQTTFIPRARIMDVIINEALTPYDVKVYVALLVHGTDRMEVLFDSFRLDTKSMVSVYETIKGHILK